MQTQCHTRAPSHVTRSSLLNINPDIMPGPCNNRKKKKRDRKHQHVPQPTQTLPESPRQLHDLDDTLDDPHPHDSPYDAPFPSDDGLFIATPNIYDPGNGPRVRDTRAFLSSFFAQPPALDDELCAEFAQEEILQMLCTVLPAESAMVRLSTEFAHRCQSLSRSCGTTRVVSRVVSVLRVDACIVWATSSRTLFRTPPSSSQRLSRRILLVNRRYLAYVGDLPAIGRCIDDSTP